MPRSVLIFLLFTELALCDTTSDIKKELVEIVRKIKNENSASSAKIILELQGQREILIKKS